MDANILSKKEVGHFFNQNFINVRIQMDRTNKDSPDVTNWYKDASFIQDHYGVAAIPTYLFFNPSGNVVHRYTSAIKESEEFIKLASDALDTNKQNYRFVWEYK